MQRDARIRFGEIGQRELGGSSKLLRSDRLEPLRRDGPELARQKSVARFNLDYVVTVAADFEVDHTGPGEVIEASFRLACR